MNIHKLYAHLFRTTGFRQERMRLFAQLLAPLPSKRIVDIGGATETWSYLDDQPQLTLVNLDRPHSRVDFPANIQFISADALNLPFRDGAFDVAFSNSVIEHVSTWQNQRRFACELRRVASQMWLQTPAREFFLEPHLLTPFIHWAPSHWQRRLVPRLTVWGLLTKPTRARVDQFLSSLRLLNRREMDALFPDCTILREKWMGLTKSYIAFRD